MVKKNTVGKHTHTHCASRGSFLAAKTRQSVGKGQLIKENTQSCQKESPSFLFLCVATYVATHLASEARFCWRKAWTMDHPNRVINIAVYGICIIAVFVHYIYIYHVSGVVEISNLLY